MTKLIDKIPSSILIPFLGCLLVLSMMATVNSQEEVARREEAKLIKDALVSKQLRFNNGDCFIQKTGSTTKEKVDCYKVAEILEKQRKES